MANAAALATTQTSNPIEAAHERWIDLVYLGRQTMGNKSLEIEILKLFRSQTEIHLEELLNIEDAAQLSVRLHTIRGAAFGVGANDVGRLAAKAEKDLKNDGNIQDCDLDKLRDALTKTNSFISGLLETE